MDIINFLKIHKNFKTLFLSTLYIVTFVTLSSGNIEFYRQSLRQMGLSLNKPEQIHITFGSKANSIVILWSSSVNEKSFVEYGNTPLSISRVVAESDQLSESSKLAKPFVYRAELKDLIQGSHYTFRIVSGVSETKSDIFSVNVPHNDPEKPHTFMVVADMGLLTKSLSLISHEALNNRYDAVFQLGDIAYDLHTQGGSRGDEFMNRIQKFTSKVPYVTIPGDLEGDKNFYQYRYRFSSPGAPWPMTQEGLWYSLNIGQAHFIGINTQAIHNDEPFHKEQLQWLAQDLLKANQNRKHFPWIVVMGHKPLYCAKTTSQMECSEENAGIREALENLFLEYGVNLYMSGHKHSYERSFPLHKSHALQMDSIDPKAPIYIVVGSLGNVYQSHEQKSSPKWLAASVLEKTKEVFARLTVINSTHLAWSAHDATNNKKLDEMLVVQHRHGPYRQSEFLSESETRSSILKEKSPAVSVQSSLFGYGNRHIMLLIGVTSFSFLVFLLLRYTRLMPSG